MGCERGHQGAGGAGMSKRGRRVHGEEVEGMEGLPMAPYLVSPVPWEPLNPPYPHMG